MTERKTKVQRLEERLAKARRDAEMGVRLKPLRSLARRLDSVEVHPDDQDEVAQAYEIIIRRIAEVEGV